MGACRLAWAGVAYAEITLLDFWEHVAAWGRRATPKCSSRETYLCRMLLYKLDSLMIFIQSKYTISRDCGFECKAIGQPVRKFLRPVVGVGACRLAWAGLRYGGHTTWDLWEHVSA